MKKLILILSVIPLIMLCGCNKQYDVETLKYIDTKNDACLKEFKNYYDNNNYDFSDIQNYHYRVADIKYSIKENSCIQFWYGLTQFNGAYDEVREYKITNETKRTNIYYCSTAIYDDMDKRAKEAVNCSNGYNKELEKLGLR